jgi:TonB family protein
MARPSAFERRIAVMLNPRVDRRPLSLRTALACAVALAVLTTATAALRAVQAPAALTGVIYDTSGGVMPAVEVTLEDAQQRKSTATTDATGRFSFPGIGSGDYVLSANLAGFKSLRDQIELRSAADWDRVVTLQVGTLQETITVRERRIPAVTPPASAAPGPVRLRVGGNVRVPRKTLDVRPVYPASMRAAGREGLVSIEAVIAADGSVSSVRVTSAQVHPDFAIAAVDAVRQWRFTPTLLNGQPVEVVMTVSVRFSLSD